MPKRRIALTLTLALALGGVCSPLATSTRAADGGADKEVPSAGAEAASRGLVKDFAEELAKFLFCTVVENGIDTVLTDINQADGGDAVTGFLIQMLEGPPSPDAAALANIQSSINEVQAQLTTLQASMNNFENSSSAAFAAIEEAISDISFQTTVTAINGYNATLSARMEKYNTIRNSYYVNGVAPTTVSAPEQQLITALMTLLGTDNFADNMLPEITAITHPTLGGGLYDIAVTNLKKKTPFEHQIYPQIYSIFNTVTSMRATALNLYKEYCAYTWQTTPLLQSDWPLLSDYLQSDVCGYQQAYEDVITETNYDVAHNPLLSKMNTLLQNAPATAKTSPNYPLDYLTAQISCPLNFNGAALPVYKVISNNGQGTYVMVKNAATLSASAPVQSTSGYVTTYTYPITLPQLSDDTGRYQLAGSAGDLAGLFPAGSVSSGALKYLTEVGGLDDLLQGPTPDGMVFSTTTPSTLQNSSKNTSFATVVLNLLNANYSSWGTTPVGYLAVTHTTSSTDSSQPCYPTTPPQPWQVTSLDVYNKVTYQFDPNDASTVKALTAANFLRIYVDTHLALGSSLAVAAVDPSTGLVLLDPTTGMAASTTYTPISAGDLPTTFSLTTGDVLDLSKLTGNLYRTLTISGDATIIGGGSSKGLTGLVIKRMAGNLTIQNLYLTASSTADAAILTDQSPTPTPFTLTVIGANSFTGGCDSTGLISSGSGQAVTLISGQPAVTSPPPATPAPAVASSLTLANTSSGPAIQTTGSLLLSSGSGFAVGAVGALHLAVSSQGPTCIAGAVSGSNATVTSTVPAGLSGSAAAVEFPGATSFSNCLLTMVYGPFPAAVQLSGTTAVTYSDIRAAVSIRTANVYGAGTSSKVYLSVVYNGGQQTTVVRVDNLPSGTPGSCFSQNSTAQFNVYLGPNVAPLSGLHTLEGIVLSCDQSNTNNANGGHANWNLAAATVSFGVQSLTVTPSMWILDSGNKFFGVTATNTGEYYVSVHTGQSLLSGTDADIYVKLIGSNGETEYQNVRHVIPVGIAYGQEGYNAFQPGENESFWMAFSGVVYDTNGVAKPGIQGIGTPQYVAMYTDDFWNSDPYWCVYIEFWPIEDAQGDKGSPYTFNINNWIAHNANGPDTPPSRGNPLPATVAAYPTVARNPKWYPHINFNHGGYDNTAQYQVEIFSGSTPTPPPVMSVIIRKRCYVESLDYICAGNDGLLPGQYSVKVAKLHDGHYELVHSLPLLVPDYGAASVASVVADPTEELGTYTFNFDLVNASGYDLEIKRNGATVQSLTATFRPDLNGVLWPNQTVAKGGVVLSEPGDYEWTVRPFNPLTAAGSPSTSSRFTVATALQPTADFQLTPAAYANMLPAGTAGTTVNGVLPVTFTWDAVSGAQDYFLYVTTTGGEVVLNRVKVEANAAYGPVNLAAGNYAWNVIATNALGVATWSHAVNFLIRTDLLENTTTPVISQLQPIDDAELAHTSTQMEFLITWDVAGDQQELWLYREDTGETYTATRAVVVHPLTHVSTIAVTAANFLAPGTYYWQVRGLKGTVHGQWSAARVYTILPTGTDLAKPRLTTTQGSDITVEFPVDTAAPGQVQFDVLAKLNGAFSKLSLAPVSGALAVTIPWAAWVAKNASLGTTKAAIFVRVRGVSDAATGPWSDWASYTNP